MHVKKGVLPIKFKDVQEINDAFNRSEIKETFGYAHSREDVKHPFFDVVVDTHKKINW